jgi:hypothetical protein
MAIQGDLYDFPLADLLSFLGNRQKSGWLTLKQGSTRMVFIFRCGKLVAARSNDASQRLGQRLVSIGQISDVELAHALELQRACQPAPALGTVLVQHGYLAQHELQSALTAQFGELVFRLIVQPSGDFRFDAGVPDLHGEPFDVSIEREVFEAMRRADEWCAEQLCSAFLRLNPAVSTDTSRLFGADDRDIIRALARGPLTYPRLIEATSKTPETVLDSITRLQATGALFIDPEEQFEHGFQPQRPKLVA